MLRQNSSTVFPSAAWRRCSSENVCSSAFRRYELNELIPPEGGTTNALSSFQGIAAATYQTPQKRVGQTASLPVFPERSHRKSQGKLPVCPTLAPRFSLFQGIATRHEGAWENLGTLAASYFSQRVQPEREAVFQPPFVHQKVYAGDRGHQAGLRDQALLTPPLSGCCLCQCPISGTKIPRTNKRPLEPDLLSKAKLSLETN
jgi:hypothetical protein